MRFVIVSRAENVSGKEIMTLELGAGLREAGHSVEFATSFWNDGTYPKRLRAMGFEPVSLNLGAISATLRWDCLRTTFRQLMHLPVLWADYLGLLRRTPSAQVIHTSWHHLLVLAPWLSPKRDWFWIHEVLPDKAHYSLVFKWLAKRLRGIVAVSHAVRESLVNAGVPSHKVHVIHNGLRNLAQGVEHIPSEVGEVRIGIVGQVLEWKGHHDLLDAFARIEAQFPSARLHVFGSGPEDYMKRLTEQAARLGISGRIVWHGFVDERARIYQRIDLCVVPSQSPDPLPTVAIEAAYFGLPTLAYTCGGLPEIIEDGKSGLLAPPGNVSELAAGLSRLVGDANLRKTLGDQARIRAGLLFSRDRFVRDFLSLTDTREAESQSSPT